MRSRTRCRRCNEKRHTHDLTRPFPPRLAPIARYKWIDRLRAMRKSPTEALTDDIAVGDHGEAVSSSHTLDRLLGELKPAQAEVIRLVKLQGLSLVEASSRTGQTVPLVKVNSHRGRLSAVRRQRMPFESLIDRLSVGLKPVRRRTVGVDAAVVGVICLAELALFLGLGVRGLGAMRPDMPVAMPHSGFWWKLTGLTLIAVASGTVALRSFDPVRSPHRGLRGVVAIVVAWGVFVFACPSDDPLYVAIWYAVACLLVAGSARLLLPRLARW